MNSEAAPEDHVRICHDRLRGDVAATLAEMFSVASEFDASRLAAAEAVRLYQQKGNLAAAARGPYTPQSQWC